MNGVAKNSTVLVCFKPDVSLFRVASLIEFLHLTVTGIIVESKTIIVEVPAEQENGWVEKFNKYDIVLRVSVKTQD